MNATELTVLMIALFVPYTVLKSSTFFAKKELLSFLPLTEWSAEQSAQRLCVHLKIITHTGSIANLKCANFVAGI